MRCSEYGQGEAVLLIHGMPTNGRLWDEVVRGLSRQYRCFVVDLPGMGGTPFLSYDSAYFAQVAAQIERVRLRHGVQRWHVVGHDAGAAIAVQYAHRFPQRVECMALLSPAIFPDLQPFFLLDILRKPIVGELVAPLLHWLFWNVAMRRAIPEAQNVPQRNSFHQSFSGISGPWKLMRLVRWGKPEIVFRDFPSILPSLECSALVIHGSRDVLPKSFSRRAADLIPCSQLIEIDSGHFSPIERATQVSAALLRYFRSRMVEQAEDDSRSHGMQKASDSADIENSRIPIGMMPLPASK